MPRDEALERRRASGSSSRPTRRSPPGNETYAPDEFLAAYARPARRGSGIDDEEFLDLCRVRPRRGGAARHDAARDPDEPAPQRRQPAARRGRRARCGGRCSRADRRRPDHARHERRPPPDLRLASRCATCSTRHLGDALARARPRHRARGRRCARSRTRSCGRRAARRAPRLVDYLRRRASRTACCAASSSTTSALIESSLDPDALTIGFARRLATYKRFHLLTHDPDRARRIFTRRRSRRSSSIAGKAHPNDEPGQGGAPALLQLRARRRRDRRAAS